MFNLQLHIRNFNLDPSGPVYISTSVPLSVLKLFCLTQNFNSTVQQGQRESASELKD